MDPKTKLLDLFFTSFPGFLSIRDEHHKIVYLNENFQLWIKKYTDIDVIGLTNQEISENVDGHVGEVFKECHDLTISHIYDNNINSKIIKFIEDDSISYLDVMKFKCELEGKTYIYTLARDITQLYNKTKDYETQAYTDELTGLHNRKIFNRLNFNESHIFIYIDLDNFKKINDMHGHLIGDDILVKFANLLQNVFRKEQDNIIRLGGDEFLIIIDVKDNIVNIDHKIHAIKTTFLELFNEFAPLNFSYGFCNYSVSLEHTLSLVDQLMYDNKNININNLC